MNLHAYVQGVGVLGPGFAGWPQTAAILAQRESYLSAPTVLPAPTLLPAAERRRVGRVVKLALAVASEATSNANVDTTELLSVFTSSGGDGYNCHEICEALAQPSREISPTRFSNSVHNAPSGYWSIAAHSVAESNVLCAYDASFAAGLLDAVALAVVRGQPVLLVAYDGELPPPLHAKRPIPDALGVAMILAPERGVDSLASIEVTLTDEPFDIMADPQLEKLRASIPAARSLPLLRLLALRRTGRAVTEYLDVSRVAVQVDPCS